MTRAANTTTTATKKSDVTYSIRSVPEYYEPASTGGGGGGVSAAILWSRSGL